MNDQNPTANSQRRSLLTVQPSPGCPADSLPARHILHVIVPDIVELDADLTGMSEKHDDSSTPPPLKRYDTIFEQEVGQAKRELERPARGLIMSGLLAGLGIGTSVLLVAIVHSFPDESLSEPARQLLAANAYAVGFVIVIMGSTDLFTEYTTIAILPVLTRDAPLRYLARLWGLIYGANIVGGAIFALTVATLAPALGVAQESAFEEAAIRLLSSSGTVMLLSGIMAGWLMGFLSWLLIAGRETVSQILFVWIIAATIGAAQLHHSIVGAIEVIAGAIVSVDIGATDILRFFVVVTAGNIIGSTIFALLIRYGTLLSGSGEGLRD